MSTFVYDVFYSEEDNGFIAHLKDMPSMSAHGDTEAEAVNELAKAVAELVAAEKEERRQRLGGSRYSNCLVVHIKGQGLVGWQHTIETVFVDGSFQVQYRRRY